MWARTLWPLLSSTRNIALGRASTTVPSISITPSFFGMSSLLVASGLVLHRPGNLPDRSDGVVGAGAGGPLGAAAQTSSRARTRLDGSRVVWWSGQPRGTAKQTQVGTTRQCRPHLVTTPNRDAMRDRPAGAAAVVTCQPFRATPAATSRARCAAS